MERLCAGVVTRLDSGEVAMASALDARKAAHAFGAAGAALASVAQALCESLAAHWRAHDDASAWVPPFEGARLAELSRFSARSVEDANSAMLARVSAMHTLLQGYEIAQAERRGSIVQRVRSVVRRDPNAQHLADRFNRHLPLRDDALPLRVDFLGQRFACYFLQLTSHTRAQELNTERAFGRLYELEALRGFVQRPKKSLGLLDDERPSQFELVMVGSASDSVQRRAIRQIEALADKREVRVRALPTVAHAAEHVATEERQAA